MDMKNLINGQKPEFGNLEQIKAIQKEQRLIDEEKEMKAFRKQMNPMEKYLDDLANIGWINFVLNNLTEKVTKLLSNRSPIDMMIDKATGYEKGILKSFLLEVKKGHIELIKNFNRIGDEDGANKSKVILDKIKLELKTDYKNVKAVEL